MNDIVERTWSRGGPATRASVGLVGREDELAALEADGPGGTLVVLTGERGSGRTTLLGSAGAAARSAGRVVLHVDLGGTRPAWDEYGIVPLLDAVNAQFEALGAGADLVRSAGADLMRSTAALRRRCTPHSYRTAAGRAAVYAATQRLLTCLPDGALVLLDDADLVNPEPLALAARGTGHRVIAAVVGRASLSGAADRLVHVEPIEDGDIERLLRRALGCRPDVRLTETLRRALGPLSGNPSSVLSMVEQLRRTNRLVTVARRVCLREPHRTPALPCDAPVMVVVGERGFVEDLVLLVDGPARIRVDDIPLVSVALGRTVREIGRVADRLVEEMILAEHDGELVVRCPAVAATLRERTSAARVRALHASVALAAKDRAHGLAPLDRDVLAEHVAAAGESLTRDTAWQLLLRGQALDQEHRSPERAARFLAATRRHGTGGLDAARTTEWALRLLLRAGDHDGVSGLVASVVAAGGHEPATLGGVDRGLLAPAAAVAALTLRSPVPAAVHAALAGDGRSTCPLLVAQKWSDGASLDVHELHRALSVLTTGGRAAGCRHSDAPLEMALLEAEAALAARDVVGALAWLLGPAYACPDTAGANPVPTPLVLLHRATTAQRSGRWDEASTWARAVFADHGTDDQAADLGQWAAMIAADIATLQGDERMVDAWREYLPDRTAESLHPILCAGVQVARLWTSGDGDAALTLGWRTWADVGPQAVAIGRGALLTRLCGIAAVERHQQWYPRLLSAAVEWRRTARGAEAADAAETWDLLRGVLGDDDVTGRAILARAVARARNLGRRAELVWVLLAAGAVAPDPTAAWSEAHTIAREIGAPLLRVQLRKLMDTRGVRRPANRPRAEDLTSIQLRIMELLERGMTNRQIARDVRVSEKTVENHLTRLFVRFGCRTRHELATARLRARRDELEVGA